MASMIHNASGRIREMGLPQRRTRTAAQGQQVTQFCSQGNPGTEEIYRKASSFSISAPRCLWPKGRKEEDAATAKKGEDPMSTSAYTRLSVIILAALALAACPEKKVKKHDETPTAYWVSPAGSDTTNPGTEASPFKTITYALRVAT